MANRPDPEQMSTEELRAAYLATSGEPGDLWADALAAELQRREEDV